MHIHTMCRHVHANVLARARTHTHTLIQILVSLSEQQSFLQDKKQGGFGNEVLKLHYQVGQCRELFYGQF